MRRFVSILLLSILLVGMVLVGAASGATLILTPSNDGIMTEGDDNFFPTMILANGDTVTNNPATTENCGVYTAKSSSQKMDYGVRCGLTFQTGAVLNESVTITGATITVTGDTRYNGLNATSLEVTDFFPTDSGQYVATDFAKTTRLSQSNNISYADFVISGPNILTLNAAGIANVSKTANSTFMLENSATIYGGNLSDTWTAGGTSGFKIKSAATTTTKPKLTVTYYLPAAAEFGASTTTPTAGDSVTFTDTSIGEPTAWNWSFGDGTNSTSQNPSHTYASPGTYTVTLWIATPLGGDGEVKTDYITVATAPAACPVNLAAMYNITGNGTDEAPGLNAAFAYTRSVGTCKVTFPADAVIRFNSTVNMSENLELDGQNATLKVSDNHGDGSGESMIVTAANDWWHDLNFHENDLNLGGTIDYGVRIADWVVIEDSRFYNLTEYGLEGFHTDNWVFRNNLIENSTQYGIATGGSTGWSDNVTVTGNTIKWCKEVGVKVRGTRDSTVTYNKVTLTTSGTGLRFYTNDAPVEDVTIESNTITSDPASGTTYGLTASPGDYCLGCVFRNNSIDGAYYGIGYSQTNDNSSVLVEDNTFTNTRRASVLLYGNNGRFYDNTFDRGIYLGAGSGYHPTNNTFRGNIIQNGTTFPSSPEYGEGDGFFFWAGSAPNTTIDFNHIAVPNHGININSSYGVIDGAVITNNEITSIGECIFDLGTGTVKANNTCNGVPEATTPLAMFTQSKIRVRIPQSVTMTDTSTNTPTSWEWSWGDRSANSTTQNPSHIYRRQGVFTITLTAINVAGQSSNTTKIYVTGGNSPYRLTLTPDCFDLQSLSFSRETTEYERTTTIEKIKDLC